MIDNDRKDRSPGPVYVVGAGRVGAALASLIERSPALELAGQWSRSARGAARAEAVTRLPCAHGPFPDLIAGAAAVIIAVSDPVVPVVAGALLDGGLFRGATAVLHCGGSRPAAEALAPLESVFPLGTLHPLLAITDPGQAARSIPGAYFAVEGSDAAVSVARQLAKGVGASAFRLRAEQMTLYHCAAVIASNHTVALWHAATRLMCDLGLGEDLAGEVLGPLLRSSLQNTEAQGIAGALSGPVRRGDPHAIRRHLRALEQGAPHLLRLYQACTEAAAEAAGGVPEMDDALRRSLDEIRKLVRTADRD